MLIKLLEQLEKRKLRQFKSTNRSPRHKYDQLETIGLILRHLEGVGKMTSQLGQEGIPLFFTLGSLFQKVFDFEKLTMGTNLHS